MIEVILTVISCILLIIKSKFIIISILLLLYRIYISKKYIYIVFILICIIRSIIYINTEVPNNFIGRVKSVISDSQVVISNPLFDVLVIYDNHSFLLDEIVIVEGNVISFDDSYHSYYQKTNPLNQNKILIASSIKKTEYFLSLKTILHKYINNMDEGSKRVLLQTILRITDKEDESLFLIIGYQYTFLFMFISFILEIFITKEEITKLELVYLILLFVFWGFEYTLFKLLLFRVCRYYKLDKQSQIKYFVLITFLISPKLILDLKFLYSFIFLITPLININYKYLNYLIIMLIQSFYFMEFSLFRIIGMPIIHTIQGILYLFSILRLFVNFNIVSIYNLFKGLNSVFDLVILKSKIPFILLIIIVLIVLKYNKRQLIISSILLCLLFKFRLFYPYSEVVFINIGQGDSTLIRIPKENYVALIDTGTSSNYKKLDTMLKVYGIEVINDLFITHSDSDHNGAVDLLLDEYKVINIYTNEIAFNNVSNTITYLQLNDFSYDNENDNSLILSMSINDLSFLFLGDVSKSVEKDIVQKLNLDIDILKLAHHGSNTSTSQELLENTTPLLCINSSGVNNYYGHPHEEVIEIINRYNLTLIDTQYNGDIHIIFSKFYNLLVTSNKEFGIIGKK